MSVEQKRADPAILRKFGLSKQEETLKQKLLQKKGGQNQPGSRSGNNSTHMSPQKANSTSKNGLSVSNKRKEYSESDKMTEQFLKSMEKEFQDLNKKQITMGMLNTNTALLKRQTEILNENQMNIANMVKENKQQSMRAGGTMSEDAQKQLMRSIIGPINEEIKEIKSMYENTRHLAENVQRSVNDFRHMTERNDGNGQQFDQYQRTMDDNFGNYRSMNSNLRDMVHHAQGDLSQLLPENMQIIQQMSDLNVQAYTNCINNLKKQIEDLQRDAEKAEKELESRYKKLSQVPKPGTIKPNDPYYPLVANGPETSEDVIKNVRTIDFQTSRQIIINKLGGEFDYEQYNHEVAELANSIYDIRNQALEDAATYEIDLPSELELLEYDRNIVNATVTAPSILDEIKAKYNIPKQMVMPKPVVSPVVPTSSQNQFGPSIPSLPNLDKDQDQIRSKKKSIKPKVLGYIRTVPHEPLPDVRYSKIQEEPWGERPRKAPVEPPKKAQEVPRKEPTETRGYQENKEQQEEDYNQEKWEAEEEDKRPSPPKTETRGPQTYINMDRYDMKIGSQNQVNPRGDQDLSFEQVRGTDALFNRLFEGLLLQDIKEQIVYSNVHPSGDAGETSPRFRVQEQPVQAPPMKVNIPGNIQGNTQLFYPQLLTSQNKELHTEGVDDKLLQQLTLEAFAEKLLPSLRAESRNTEQEKSSSLFQPVQTKPIPDIRPAENNASQQQNSALLNLGVNNPELPTLIAENIMNLFNSAMMQINTSLSKNFGQVSQVDPLNLRSKQEIDRTVSNFTRKEEQKDSTTQQISREKPQEDSIRQPEGLSLKPNLFSKGRKESTQKDEIEQGFESAQKDNKEASRKTETKKPVTLYDALNREQKLIQEEQDILRQRKHFLSPAQNLASQFGMSPQQGYYFNAHEPQPIANLSEYYRELQSDIMSNSDVNISRPASVRHVYDPSPGEVRKNWGTNTPSATDNDMLSEGQVFPNFDQRTEGGYGSEAGEVPGFSASKTMVGDNSEMSMDPRFNSIQKGLLTDNLFKNVHEEDREPGENSIPPATARKSIDKLSSEFFKTR